MEFISKLRWVVVVIAMLLLLVLVGWGIISIARGLFSGGSTSTSQSDDTSIFEVNEADTVRYTVEGPVVASAEHRSYTIEVSRNVVIMRVYSDYGQTVIDEKSYSNNELSYENFIESLDKQNASARVKGTDTDDDFAELGACSAGRVHILEIGDEIRRWRTNCETVPGTAGGNMPAIRKLFAKQVPDFRDMIKGLGLI